jgi:tripartite motif-containing protein 71
VWVADVGHDRIQEFNSKGEFVREFGTGGSANGEFSNPRGIAVNKSTGNVYVSDDGNERVQEFNSKGEFIRVFGKKGKGEGEFTGLRDVVIDSEGHVWTIEDGREVFSEGKTRVQEFTGEGVYISQFGTEGTGNGQFKEPEGVTVDSKGNVWVADTANDRVQEINAKGEFVRVFGSEGSGNGQFKRPVGLAFDAEGDLWVGDSGNDRLQRFTSTGGYLSQVGTPGNENGQFNRPEGIAIDSSGNIWIADSGNSRVQELTGSEFVRKLGGSGSGAGQLSDPAGVAMDSSGNIWVADAGHDRVQEFNSKGEFVREFGTFGSANGEFSNPRGIAVNKSTGNVYVSDDANERVQEFNSKGEFIRVFGKKGKGNGEFTELRGIAIDPEGHVWTVEAGKEEVFSEGKTRVQEFTSEGGYISQFGREGMGNVQFKEPEGITVDSKSNVWIGDTGNNRVQEISAKGEFIRAFGSEGSGYVQFEKPTGLAFDAEGDLWVADSGNDRIQRVTSEGGYLSQIGTPGDENGQFSNPEGITITSSGNAVAADTRNNRIQVWTPEHRFAHDTQTIYYTSGQEARVAVCQSHPEWADLPCHVEPSAQPLDTGEGKPKLPVVTMKYNIWDEIETTTEVFGTVTRTKTQTYDPAGRAMTSEETSTLDTALPKVTNEYNTETGALEKQSATIKSEVKTITAKDNTLGQLAEYKDSTGNIAKYTYEESGDGRLLKVSEGKGEEAKSTQTYSYDPTTGFMTELVDSNAGTFKASYDAEGKMISETYPNGMCANTTYDPTGTATSISYIKTRNCSESKPTVWFTDSVVPGVHGEMLSQTSTLASEGYAYDTAGRLLETQETPVGKGCTTRLYAYDEESNRMSLTSREPKSEGKCATEGGMVQHHVYDEADRLVDASVEYETFGNTTKLPAADAGEHEIKSTYYVDNQVATQEQNKTLDSYLYDPAGRTMETSTENTETKTKSTIVSHYAGTGGPPTWTSEGTEKWSRNIPGIDGSLQATAEPGKTVILQLRDLQGNIIATAADNETETKLLSTYNSTEFGVPTEGKTPPKYAWLGASGLATETSFGTGIATQSGASYIPQVARDLQTTPVVPPGAFPNGQGTGEQYDSEIPGWYISLSGQESAATLAEWTAKQEQLKRETEEKAGGGGEEGSPIDPEGLMTGKEALTLAHELNQEGESLAGYAREETCGHAFNPEPAKCELETEIGERQDPALGKALEGCWFQVHNPGWLYKHFYTKACLVEFNYSIGLGADRVIYPGWHVSICFSYHVGAHSITYSTSSWWCESDKKWWNFYNRGWWEDT